MVQIHQDFVSAGCNRHVGVADWLNNGSIIYGSYKSIAVYQPDDQSHTAVTLHGHTDVVNVLQQVVLSDVCLQSFTTPKEALHQTFLSGSQDGTVRLWLLQGDTWETVAVYEIGSPVICIACPKSQNDQSLLCVGGSNGDLTIWSLEYTEAPLHSLHLENVLPLDVAMTTLPGTSQCLFALATTDTKVRLLLWDKAGLRKLCELQGHEDWVRSLSLVTMLDVADAKGKRREAVFLASGSHDRYIRIWKIAPIICQFDGRPQGDAHADGSLDNITLLSDDLLGYDLSVNTNVFSIDSNASSREQFVATFEALLVGHDDKVFAVRWHPGMSSRDVAKESAMRLLSASADKSMIIWGPEDFDDSLTREQSGPAWAHEAQVWVPQARLGEIGGTNLGFYGALWSPSGTSVAAHGHRGSWHRWVQGEDGSNLWKSVPSPGGHSRAVQDIDWDPHGQFVVSTSLDQTTRIWAKGTGDKAMLAWSEVSRPQIHGYNIQAVAMLDQTTILSGADEKVLRVFSMPEIVSNSLKAIGLELHGNVAGKIQAATLPALGLSNRAVTGDGEERQDHLQGEEALVEPPRFEDVISLPILEEELIRMTLWPEIEKLYGHGDEILAIAGSPDGKWIASSCKAHSAEHAVVRLHNRKTWQESAQPLSGHTLSITRCVFSNDSRWLLTVSRDRYWHLYRASEDAEAPYTVFAKAKSHARIIWDAAFAADNVTFATASRDKTVRVWRIQEDSTDETSRVKLLATLEMTESVTAIDLQSIDQFSASRASGQTTMLMVVGLENGTIHLYRGEDVGSSWHKIADANHNGSHVDAVRRIKFRPSTSPESDGQTFASCGTDSTVRFHRIGM